MTRDHHHVRFGFAQGAQRRKLAEERALSGELGPKFGRGMGMAAEERQLSNLVRSPMVAQGAHGAHAPGKSNGAKQRVPGFPQDMMMPMDDAVAKPETLIYMLAYKDGAARDAAWAAFGADPEWVKTRTAMQVNVQVDNVFMSATDYSPIK